MLIPISEKEFKENVEIKFSNITEGFNRYSNKTLEVIDNKFFEEKMIEFLEEIVKINGIENSYVDFYYNALSKDDRDRLKEMIDYEDKLFISEFEREDNEGCIYFRLSMDSIPFINKLNSREILFSTMYFTKEPCTIWGNYNKKFPVFYKDSNIINKYEDIAMKIGIRLV